MKQKKSLESTFRTALIDLDGRGESCGTVFKKREEEKVSFNKTTANIMEE